MNSIQILMQKHQCVDYDTTHATVLIKEITHFKFADETTIYVLNASCSDCIGKFVDFVKTMKNGNYNGRLCVLINFRHKTLLETYLHEFFPNDTIQILSIGKGARTDIIENNEYNGIIMSMKNNTIQNAVIFNNFK